MVGSVYVPGAWQSLVEWMNELMAEVNWGTWRLLVSPASTLQPWDCSLQSYTVNVALEISTVRAGHPQCCLLPRPSSLLWSRAFCVCRESRIIKGGGVLKAIQGCPLFLGVAPGQWSTNRGSQATHGSFKPRRFRQTRSADLRHPDGVGSLQLPLDPEGHCHEKLRSEASSSGDGLTQLVQKQLQDSI